MHSKQFKILALPFHQEATKLAFEFNYRQIAFNVLLFKIQWFVKNKYIEGVPCEKPRGKVLTQNKRNYRSKIDEEKEIHVKWLEDKQTLGFHYRKQDYLSIQTLALALKADSSGNSSPFDPILLDCYIVLANKLSQIKTALESHIYRSESESISQTKPFFDLVAKSFENLKQVYNNINSVIKEDLETAANSLENLQITTPSNTAGENTKIPIFILTNTESDTDTVTSPTLALNEAAIPLLNQTQLNELDTTINTAKSNLVSPQALELFTQAISLLKQTGEALRMLIREKALNTAVHKILSDFLQVSINDNKSTNITESEMLPVIQLDRNGTAITLNLHQLTPTQLSNFHKTLEQGMNQEITKPNSELNKAPAIRDACKNYLDILEKAKEEKKVGESSSMMTPTEIHGGTLIKALKHVIKTSQGLFEIPPDLSQQAASSSRHNTSTQSKNIKYKDLLTFTSKLPHRINEFPNHRKVVLTDDIRNIPHAKDMTAAAYASLNGHIDLNAVENSLRDLIENEARTEDKLQTHKFRMAFAQHARNQIHHVEEIKTGILSARHLWQTHRSFKGKDNNPFARLENNQPTLTISENTYRNQNMAEYDAFHKVLEFAETPRSQKSGITDSNMPTKGSWEEVGYLAELYYLEQTMKGQNSVSNSSSSSRRSTTSNRSSGNQFNDEGGKKDKKPKRPFGFSGLFKRK